MSKITNQVSDENGIEHHCIKVKFSSMLNQKKRMLGDCQKVKCRNISQVNFLTVLDQSEKHFFYRVKYYMKIGILRNLIRYIISTQDY